MVFPVVMYGCESWTVKKAEHWKIHAFELWCWRRLLRVPWTARRSNQSILKEMSPGCSLEGLMLKLKLQYFGHLMRRVDSLEKTLMLGEIGGGGEGDDRGWDGWMASLTRWTWVWVNSGSWWWTGRLGMLWFLGSQIVRHDWATELNWCYSFCCVWLFVTPWTIAHQAPLSMGILQARILKWVATSFSRGSSCNRSHPGLTLQTDSLSTEAPGKPDIYIHIYIFIYRLLQDIEYSSPCYTVGPCHLSIL